MRAGSAIASGARHGVSIGFQALLIAAIIAMVALAMSAVYRPAGFVAGVADADAAPTRGVTIAFANAARTSAGWPVAGDDVSFRVGTDGVKTRDLAKLWVANKCSQDGSLVYAQYLAVHNGQAGPFELSWGGGTASCTAYVWMFPSSESPLKGASMDYDAN
jgi:hypothetical protein